MAEIVFGKQVQVVSQDVDRYGRIVGIVYVDDVCVNEELIRNGLAWVLSTVLLQNSGLLGMDGVGNCSKGGKDWFVVAS